MIDLSIIPDRNFNLMEFNPDIWHHMELENGEVFNFSTEDAICVNWRGSIFVFYEVYQSTMVRELGEKNEFNYTYKITPASQLFEKIFGDKKITNVIKEEYANIF